MLEGIEHDALNIARRAPRLGSFPLWMIHRAHPTSRTSPSDDRLFTADLKSVPGSRHSVQETQPRALSN
jgi:hypothetical protein